MDEDLKDKIELHAHRVLSREAAGYREHLEKQLAVFKTAIIGISFVAGLLFVALLGKTYSEIESQVKARLNEILVREEVNHQIALEVSKSIRSELSTEDTSRIIERGVKERIGAVLAEKYEKPLMEAVNQKRKEISEIDSAAQLHTIPVGTVLASMIPPEEFARILPGSESFNPTVSIWSLADGREVKGSAYSRESGRDRVPDLRGTFLRGLNVGRQDGWQDPAGLNRRPGSMQEDSYGTHIHEVSVAEHTHAFPGVTETDLSDTLLKPMNLDDYLYRPRSSLNLPDTLGVLSGFSAGYTGDSTPSASEIEVQERGGLETRPKNVAAYFYIKIN